MRLQWISFISKNLGTEEVYWNSEYDQYPCLVSFLQGDQDQGYAAAVELLSEGVLIPVLNDNHFLLIFYDLLANMTCHTPKYVIAMIVRRFLKILSTGRLVSLPRFIIDDIKLLLVSAVEMGWHDKKRIDRLKARIMLW